MNILKRIVFALLAVGLLLLLFHAATRYVLPYWVPILFYAYALVAVAVTGDGVVKALAAGQPTNLRDLATISASDVAYTKDFKGRIAWLRDWIGGTTQLVAESIVWPVPFFLGMRMQLQTPDRKLTAREIMARLATNCYDHFLSLFTLAAVGVVYYLLLRGVNLGRYGLIVLGAMLAAVALRLFSYIVGRTPLAAKLRRAIAFPYPAFLLVIASDFVSLVVSLTILGRTDSVQRLQFGDFKATAEAVYKLQEPIDVLRGMTLNFHQIVIGIVGLLFGGALFKIATEFGEFKRNDEDYVWLGSAANELGQYSTTLKYLGNVEKWDRSAHAVKLIALIGVNDLDAAEHEAGMLDRAGSGAPDNEWTFVALTEGCLMARSPSNVVASVLKRGMDQGVRDVILQGSIAQFVADESSANEFLKVVTTDPDHYHMAHFIVQLLLGHGAEAAADIEAIHYDDPLSEIVRLLLLVRGRVAAAAKPEDESAAVHNWMVTKLPEVKPLIKALKDPFDASVAFTSLLSIVVLARGTAPDSVEELTYLSDALKAKAASEGTALKFMEARFEHFKALPQTGN